MTFYEKRKKREIKKTILELDSNNQFLIKLPPEIWKDKSKLKDTIKKLDSFTERDINVVSIDYNEKAKSTYYIIEISDLVKFAFTEKEDGEISYIQIPLEEN